MKNLFRGYMLATLAAGLQLLLPILVWLAAMTAPVPAQAQSFRVNCVAAQNGVLYVADVLAWNAADCASRMRECTGNPNVNWQYRDTYVTPPFKACSRRIGAAGPLPYMLVGEPLDDYVVLMHGTAVK